MSMKWEPFNETNRPKPEDDYNQSRTVFIVSYGDVEYSAIAAWFEDLQAFSGDIYVYNNVKYFLRLEPIKD